MIWLVTSALVTLIGFNVWSTLRPVQRIWPPHGRDWRFHLVWALNYVFFLGNIAIGVLAWPDALWPLPIRIAGAGVAVAGKGFAFLSSRQLGKARSSGLSGELMQAGMYRYCRNPQYLGNIVFNAGLIALFAAPASIVTGMLTMAYFASLPFPEEKWLTELHGAPYRDYLATTPRFVPAMGTRAVRTR